MYASAMSERERERDYACELLLKCTRTAMHDVQSVLPYEPLCMHVVLYECAFTVMHKNDF